MEQYTRLAVRNGRRAPRRVVLKVGTRLLTGGEPELQRSRMEGIVSAIARHPETETVLVSSGAIAAGFRAFGMDWPPAELAARQAAAAVGQARLMRMYTEIFDAYGITAGQVLLTNDVLQDRTRSMHARNTFNALFRGRVVPVVNENDTVSVEEIRVGDNDNLAAHSAALVEADLLVLLTDIDGVYDRDPVRSPDARLIPYAATAAVLRPYCWSEHSVESIGGMTTKLEAAEKAAGYGIPTIIAGGLRAESIDAVYTGRPVGTLIPCTRAMAVRSCS